MKSYLFRSLFCFALCGALYANPIVLTQSFENPEGTDWSVSLGVNSTATQITNGTAADGSSHVRFTLGENTVDDFSSAAIFGQYLWDDTVTLDEFTATMQVRGEEATYMVLQVVPNPSDLSNQFFVIGGSLNGTLSDTEWTTWSAGQSDPFHVTRNSGTTYELPDATKSNQMILSDLINEPIRLESDGSLTGLTWGDAQVRWVTPTAGYNGGGFTPSVVAELDQLVVAVIPEPSIVALLLAMGGFLLGARRYMPRGQKT